MQNYPLDTAPVSSPFSDVIAKPTIPSGDYCEILNAFGLEYKENGYYLQVGEITKVQRWILHISVISSQIRNLLDKLVPFLERECIAFKIVRNKELADCILNGNMGYAWLGKLLSIYPGNDLLSLELAVKLIALTSEFRGPDIPSAFHLGNQLYTSYQDIDSIPFSMPAWTAWPFTLIIEYAPPLRSSLLNNRYKPIFTIKPDAKGNVCKAIYASNILMIRTCIIKEGKKNMWANEAGKDMQDRLQWQRKLNVYLLANKVRVPKIIELFKENGNSYLVMECIKGASMLDLILKKYKGKTWLQLLKLDRIQLLNYLLKVIEAINELHRLDIIHRDISPDNFIISKKGQLFLIDLEMAYDIRNHSPEPHFSGGTPGFISPEQAIDSVPYPAEDVYGLGALMIVLFTSLSPTRFETTRKEMLIKNLFFIIGNQEISTLIASCLEEDSKNRPDFPLIKQVIENVKNELAGGTALTIGSGKSWVISAELINRLIEGSIHGLSCPLMTTHDGLWLSKTLQKSESIGNEQNNWSIYGGFHHGISGVLYLLSQASSSGFPVEKKSYTKGIRFLRTQWLDRLAPIPSGLFHGAAGMALTIAGGIHAGLLAPDRENSLYIRDCLQKTPIGLNIEEGAAGQGLAILSCSPFLLRKFFEPLIQRNLDLVLKDQQGDGSWILDQDGKTRQAGKLGFSNGVAGIVYFLLVYLDYYSNDQVKRSVLKALGWLLKQVRHSFKHLRFSSLPVSFSPKENETFSALITLIKAFGHFGNIEYKDAVEDVLRLLPENIVSYNLTQASGLSGLGEIYLEATRVFKNDHWQERADWIARFLMQTYRVNPNSPCYWMQDETNVPTADFLTGNGGIVHYLLRLAKPGYLDYPLSPNFKNQISYEKKYCC